MCTKTKNNDDSVFDRRSLFEPVSSFSTHTKTKSRLFTIKNREKHSAKGRATTAAPVIPKLFFNMKVSILLESLVAGICCGFVSCVPLDRKDETSSLPGLRAPFRPRPLTQGTITQMLKEDEVDRNEDPPTISTKTRALVAEQSV